MTFSFNVITKEQLKEKLDRGEPVQVVDIRPYSAYYQEHIPSAQNIPFDHIADRSDEALNPGEPIVLYGADDQDMLVNRAAEILAGRKFDPNFLYLLSDGITGWRGGGYFTTNV